MGLIKGEDYYLDKNGNLVMTREYQIKRGYCCKNGCRHCPYDYKDDKKKKKGRPGLDNFFS